jgi:hypothetical protein
VSGGDAHVARVNHFSGIFVYNDSHYETVYRNVIFFLDSRATSELPLHVPREDYRLRLWGQQAGHVLCHIFGLHVVSRSIKRNIEDADFFGRPQFTERPHSREGLSVED